MKENNKMEKEMNFETKMNRLNEIVEDVENSTLSLKDSLKLYEEGMKLIKELTTTLDEAEDKIKKFTTTSDK